jgi:DNA-binding response OmpR family regulator
MPAIPNILLVEDDVELSQLVTRRLTESGYDVRTAATGTGALAEVALNPPDLVLLDIMLPELDGLEVCRRIRASHPLMYIIMLTARSEEMDRVVGLEVGADDYITKPFGLSELVARVRSALRRLRLTEENSEKKADIDTIIDVGSLHIDVNKRIVLVGTDSIVLTVLEFDLLVFLARQVDQPFSRLQLLDKVWDKLKRTLGIQISSKQFGELGTSFNLQIQIKFDANFWTEATIRFRFLESGCGFNHCTIGHWNSSCWVHGMVCTRPATITRKRRLDGPFGCRFRRNRAAICIQ